MNRSRAVLCVLLMSCTSSTSTGPGNACSANSDCTSGTICNAGTCIQLCTSNGDCTGGEVCGPDGLCAPPQGGVLPDITDVIGNDAGDATKMVDGMIIQGSGLGDVTFELQTLMGVTSPLVVRSQSPTQAEVVLPVDVLAGDYVLVATNAVGNDQQGVTLSLPDITGDVLIGRINDPTTTATIALNRLAPGLQERVTGTCAAGSAIRTINSDGTVVCEDDDVLDQAAVEGFVTGALTGDAVPYFDGSGLADSVIAQDNMGNVGVGVSNPSAPFQVEGGGFSYTDQGNLVSNTMPRCDCDIDPEAVDCVSPFSTSNWLGADCYDWWSTTAGTGADGEAHYLTTDRPDITVTTAGQVGIGTASPSYALHVNGGIHADWSASSTITKMALASPAYELIQNVTFACGSGAPYAAAGPLNNSVNADIDWSRVQFAQIIGSGPLGDQNGDEICSWYGLSCTEDITLRARYNNGTISYTSNNYNCNKGWGEAWPGWAWYQDSSTAWSPGGYWLTIACCQ